MGITRDQLVRIADTYPADLRSRLHLDVDRQLFQINLVSKLAPGGRLLDIGGGLAMLTPGAADAGMDAILIDDFDDAEYHLYGEDALRAHRERGVTIHTRDVIADGLAFEPESLDVVTSIDSMEHFHHSPRVLFHEVLDSLKPGGWFIVGVPNCVNLRKRIMVPLGRCKWSAMADWYDTPVFRGHVREPDVDDLRSIARDLRLVHVSILGRNWLGYKSNRAWVRRVTPVVDRILRLRPSLCSDIYLVGRKPTA